MFAQCLADVFRVHLQPFEIIYGFARPSTAGRDHLQGIEDIYIRWAICGHPGGGAWGRRRSRFRWPWFCVARSLDPAAWHAAYPFLAPSHAWLSPHACVRACEHVLSLCSQPVFKVCEPGGDVANQCSGVRAWGLLQLQSLRSHRALLERHAAARGGGIRWGGRSAPDQRRIWT